MCCSPKAHFCRNSKFFFQTHNVEVCSKAGKRDKELQPPYLCSKEGSFSCLHNSCSKSHKDFAFNHIVPLFMRAELLFPSWLVPAGFVCEVPRAPPPANVSEDLLHSAYSCAAYCKTVCKVYYKPVCMAP